MLKHELINILTKHFNKIEEYLNLVENYSVENIKNSLSSIDPEHAKLLELCSQYYKLTAEENKDVQSICKLRDQIYDEYFYYSYPDLRGFKLILEDSDDYTESCFAVFSMNGHLYKISGSYDSYDGRQFDSISELHYCVVKERVVKDYIYVNEKEYLEKIQLI